MMMTKESNDKLRERKLAFDKAKEEGIKKGRKEVELKAAKELLKHNIDINVISRSTGLSHEQIERLK